MEGMNRFYFGFALLIVIIIAFFVYVGYTVKHSQVYNDFEEYDLKYDTCMSNCKTPSVVETQDQCEYVCLQEYEERQKDN